MSFNFGALASAQIPSDIKYLKPYNIYKNVGYKSSEIKEGTTNEGNEWKCLKITFACEEGEYTESIFYPKAGDEDRREVDGANGGKHTVCSNFEITMAMVAAIGHAFNPEGFKKMQEISGKFKTFDEVVKFLVALLEKTKGKVTTSMKLVGRNSKGHVYARLPQPIGIVLDKETQQYRTFAVPVFGENLEFSAYEQKKREELANAKPTDMGDKTTDVVADTTSIDTPVEDGGDIDFDSIL